MSITKEFILTVLVFLTIFFMASVWAIDIGTSGMLAGIGSVEGFSFVRTPSQQYHLGLVLAVTSFFILCVIIIKLLLIKKNEVAQ